MNATLIADGDFAVRLRPRAFPKWRCDQFWPCVTTSCWHGGTCGRIVSMDHQNDGEVGKDREGAVT